MSLNRLLFAVCIFVTFYCEINSFDYRFVRKNNDKYLQTFNVKERRVQQGHRQHFVEDTNQLGSFQKDGPLVEIFSFKIPDDEPVSQFGDESRPFFKSSSEFSLDV